MLDKQIELKKSREMDHRVQEMKNDINIANIGFPQTKRNGFLEQSAYFKSPLEDNVKFNFNNA